jgi:uncharacterized phage-associated protein
MIPTRKVVNAIIHEFAKQNRRIDHLKLQKLLFLTAGFYAAQTKGAALIPEQFGVWEFGPVVESIYHEFKKFGSQPIDGYATEFDVSRGKSVAYIPGDREEMFWHILRLVIAKYGTWSGGQLSTLTHEPGSPWEKAKQMKQSFVDTNEMRKFYEGNLNSLTPEATS